MTERKPALAERLRRIDRHKIKLEEYRDIPEITEEALEKAVFEKVGKPVGRPRSLNPKVPVSLRLDPDVVEHFKAGGEGWQTRINEALRRAIKAAAR